MHKSEIYLAAIFLFVSPTRPVVAQNTGVTGFWKTFDETTGQLKSIVRLQEENGKLVGRVVKIFPKPGKDKNPRCRKCTGTLRDKPILGLTVVWGLVRDNSNNREWVDGSIVNPVDGKQYNCQLQTTDGGKKLEVFAYRKVLFKVGRTQFWQRAAKSEL
jgi:uncharacterized protein (DUF2147 family)